MRARVCVYVCRSWYARAGKCILNNLTYSYLLTRAEFENYRNETKETLEKMDEQRHDSGEEVKKKLKEEIEEQANVNEQVSVENVSWHSIHATGSLNTIGVRSALPLCIPIIYHSSPPYPPDLQHLRSVNLVLKTFRTRFDEQDMRMEDFALKDSVRLHYMY